MSAPSRRGAGVRSSGVHRRLATDAGPVTVRVAVPADLEAVLALRLALLREHHASPLYGRLRPDVEARARLHFAQQLVHGEHEATLLAERDGAAIGCLRVSESRGSPLLLPARHGYLASAYVVPEARRAGVLRLLVEHALAWCRARGLVEVRLHADAMNDGAARAWEALGFPVVEHLRHRVLAD